MDPVVTSSEEVFAPTYNDEVFDTAPGFAALEACVLPLTFTRTPEVDFEQLILSHDPLPTLVVPVTPTLREPRKWQKACPLLSTSIFQSPPLVVETPLRTRS